MRTYSAAPKHAVNATKKEARVQALADGTKVELTTLAPEAARHLVRPRNGFDEWASPLAALFTKYEAECGSGDVDLSLLRSSIASFTALAAPLAEVTAQLAAVAQQRARIEDTRLVQSVQAWRQMLTIYRRAKVAARSNPELARALQDFERWMKPVRHKKASSKKTTPTPVAA